MNTKNTIDYSYDGWTFSAAEEEYGGWRSLVTGPRWDKWKTRKVFIGPLSSVLRHCPGFRGRRHPQCPHLWGLCTSPRHYAPWPGWPRPHRLPHEDPHGERILFCDHRYPALFLVLSSDQNQTDLGPEVPRTRTDVYSNSLQVEGKALGWG